MQERGRIPRKLRTDVSEVQEHDTICGSCTYGSQLSLLLWTVAAVTAIALWTTMRPNGNTRASVHNRNKTPARTRRDTPGNVPLCISICAVKGESCSEHCLELRVSVSNVNDNRGCVTWISLETPLSRDSRAVTKCEAEGSVVRSPQTTVFVDS